MKKLNADSYFQGPTTDAAVVISVPAKQIWRIWSRESRKKYNAFYIIYTNNAECICYEMWYISSLQTPVPIHIYIKLHAKRFGGLKLYILPYNSLDGNNP